MAASAKYRSMTILPSQEVEQMKRTMPAWLSDAARISCGRTPANC